MDDLLAEARNGSADAMLALGRAYADGVVVPHDYSEAVIWLERAERLGNSEALLELAVAHEYGLGYDRNNNKAFILYIRAAAHAKSPLPFGIRGHVLTKNICSDEYKGLLALAEAGYAHAMYCMGKANERNVYVDRKDLRLQILSAKWMGQAAELGYPLAIVSYSGMRLKGDGHLMSQEEMAKWMLKAYEYDKKTAKSISSFYSERFGVKPDKQTEDKWEKLWNEQHSDKFKWDIICGSFASRYDEVHDENYKYLEIAAKNGDASAYLKLAYIYLDGTRVSKDKAKALEYFVKACKLTTQDVNLYGAPAAFYWSVKFISEGHLDNLDDQGLLNWFQNITVSYEGYERAMNQGFEKMNSLSKQKMEWRKNRIERLMKSQFDLLKQNAEGGNAEAQFYYSYNFNRYKGRAGHYLKWLKKSAEQGYVFAQYLLAQCHGSGDGAPIDTKECIKWLTKAAMQGMGDAQLDLVRIYSGTILRNGCDPQKKDPVDVKDYVMALAWNFVAEAILSNLDLEVWEKLNAEDIAKAYLRAIELRNTINSKVTNS